MEAGDPLPGGQCITSAQTFAHSVLPHFGHLSGLGAAWGEGGWMTQTLPFTDLAGKGSVETRAAVRGAQPSLGHRDPRSDSASRPDQGGQREFLGWNQPPVT